MTDQWDENQQDWTAPDRPEGPPPGVKSTRVAIATAVAVLLCAAVGAGIWALARDSGDDGSTAGLPGSSLPSESYGAQTATAGGGGAGGVPSDPCAAVSDAVAAEWGLRYDAAADGGCRWAMRDDDTRFLAVRYSDQAPAAWATESPIAVDGVPSAGSYSDALMCWVTWPTSFGWTTVSALQTYDAGGRDLCDVAADFAADVAPAVPD